MLNGRKPTDAEEKAMKEAVAWFRVMSQTSITTDQVLDFRQWRVQSGNEAAWNKVSVMLG